MPTSQNRVAVVATCNAVQKGRILSERKDPNIHYFVAKSSIVAIYAIIERLLWSLQQMSYCFRELSMKVSLLLSESFQRAFEEIAFGEVLQSLLSESLHNYSQNYPFLRNCTKQCFVAKICNYALSETAEGFCCAVRKPANTATMPHYH